MYADHVLFSKNDCESFCRDELIENDSDYDWTDEFCCDYEDWADGTYNCYVIEGHEIIA